MTARQYLIQEIAAALGEGATGEDVVDLVIRTGWQPRPLPDPHSDRLRGRAGRRAAGADRDPPSATDARGLSRTARRRGKATVRVRDRDRCRSRRRAFIVAAYPGRVETRLPPDAVLLAIALATVTAVLLLVLALHQLVIGDEDVVPVGAAVAVATTT